MVKSNYWNHKNKLTAAWYDGSTGIEPLDEAIKGHKNMAIHII